MKVKWIFLILLSLLSGSCFRSKEEGPSLMLPESTRKVLDEIPNRFSALKEDMSGEKVLTVLGIKGLDPYTVLTPSISTSFGGSQVEYFTAHKEYILIIKETDEVVVAVMYKGPGHRKWLQWRSRRTAPPVNNATGQRQLHFPTGKCN